MTELKTLKDILFPFEILRDDEDDLRLVLRQEAIKWIKSKHCRNFATAFDSDLMSNAHEAIGAEKILRHFFNITEEELKNPTIADGKVPRGSNTYRNGHTTTKMHEQGNNPCCCPFNHEEEIEHLRAEIQTLQSEIKKLNQKERGDK